MRALQAVSEIFRDREWDNPSRPNIKTFIDDVRADNDIWRVADVVAPHVALAPSRFSASGTRIEARALKTSNSLLEHLFLEGVLWGLANPGRVQAWYRAHAADQVSRVPFMREAGLTVDGLPDWDGFLDESDAILGKYEQDIAPLPPIHEKLLLDARAIGVEVNAHG
jgi:hypothetical protein